MALSDTTLLLESANPVSARPQRSARLAEPPVAPGAALRRDPPAVGTGCASVVPLECADKRLLTLEAGVQGDRQQARVFDRHAERAALQA